MKNLLGVVGVTHHQFELLVARVSHVGNQCTMIVTESVLGLYDGLIQF